MVRTKENSRQGDEPKQAVAQATVLAVEDHGNGQGEQTPPRETSPSSEPSDAARRHSRRKLRWMPIARLVPNPRNPRKHSRSQVRALARSIESFGFNAPVLVDKDFVIVVGHGRVEAAKLAGLESIPVIVLDDLTSRRNQGLYAGQQQALRPFVVGRCEPCAAFERAV